MLFSSPWEHVNRPSRQRTFEDGRAPTVLLVGGARPRAAYRSILSQRGYDLIDAGDAEDAVALARKLRPQLVMVELLMPAGDGWEVNRRLKASEETYLIPVVATSMTKLPPGTYHRARSAGFVDYITQPLERRHLLEVVATWVRQPSQLIV